MTRALIQKQVAVVTFHDPFGNTQAKTGALADFFGGKKRLHDFILNVTPDPGSAINDVEFDGGKAIDNFEANPFVF